MRRSLIESSPASRRARVRLVGLCAALVVALILGLVPASSADTAGDKKKLDAGIAALHTVLEGTSQDLARAFAELQRTEAALPAARRGLTIADAAQAVADRNNQTLATALAVAKANAAKAMDELGQNARDSRAVQNQLANFVRNDYQRGGVSGLSIALEAVSPEDFTNRLLMMDTVIRVQNQTLRGLDSLQAQGRATQAHLVAVRQQVAALKVQSEAALARARAARVVAAEAKAKLDRLYAAQTRYEAAVAARKATEGANLARMQAASDALAAELAARAKAAREAAARGSIPLSSPGAPSALSQRSSTGFLSYPVSAPVSSEFGPRLDPITGVWGFHPGMDFAAACGSPVYAAADGDVIMTTPESLSGGYGNRLIIDHGLQRGVDLTTTYNHLSSFVVTSGHVARGQLVAYSGTTGYSTGCHLHFETRQDGTPVNPRLWL